MGMELPTVGSIAFWQASSFWQMGPQVGRASLTNESLGQMSPLAAQPTPSANVLAVDRDNSLADAAVDQRGKAADMDFANIRGLQVSGRILCHADPGRCPGEDQITRPQREELRQMSD